MTVRVSPSWLARREPADAAARAAELVEHIPRAAPWVVHDLGCGTGGMGRWLAPRLGGPQHWVLHDRDEDLLAVAGLEPPRAAGVTVETRRSDLTRLRPEDLAGATLVTASALLDLLTADELAGLVALCAGARCPALLTLSVVGRVELAPAEPLDERFRAAFNAHQRRGRLLGPDAVAVAEGEFARRGYDVRVRPSPWRLGPGQAELLAEWLSGWVGAAAEQEPALPAGAYLERRLTQLAAGELAVTVEHADLLALAPEPR